MAKRGLIRSIYEGFIDAVMRKEVVGHDKMGNQYMRWNEMLKGQKVERREVKWSQPYMLYDPHAIPAEWRMWLRQLRDQPPTEQEIEQSAAKAAAFQQKVTNIEELEQQRRVRQAAQGAQASQPGSRPPDMSRLLQQMQQDSGATQGTQPGGSGDSSQPGSTGRPGQ